MVNKDEYNIETHKVLLSVKFCTTIVSATFIIYQQTNMMAPRFMLVSFV